MSHDNVRPEIAMVAKLRVEVRGESMQAAEAVAFQALDHARLAGVFEGYVPTTGDYKDHFFNRPEVTRKYDEGPEPWTELGLPYFGRLTFEFEPMSAYGGLQQIGFKVEREEDEPLMPDDSEHGYIVLGRQRPVTREHTWEVSSLRDSAGETGETIFEDIRSIRYVIGVRAILDMDGVNVVVEMDGWENVEASGKTLREAAAKARKAVLDALDSTKNVMATADEIIDNIERLVGVANVTVRDLGRGKLRVLVTFTDEDGRPPVEGRGGTAREAALNAYGLCGADVTHYNTVRPAAS